MLALPGLPWQELVTWHVRVLLEHLLLEHLPERRGLSLGLSRHMSHCEQREAVYARAV